jgi:ketosteroid isomerase-like protein
MKSAADFDALYDAFNARDLAAVLACLDPDVIWPNGWEGGMLHGREAVRDYWLRQWAEIDPRVTPMGHMIEGDGRIAVDVHQVIRSLDGAELARSRVTHVYRIRDNLIRSMEIRDAHG